MIRLHSSAAYHRPVSAFFTARFSDDAVRYCVNAVHMILKLCAHFVKYDIIDKLGPPFAYTLWVAGRVLLVHGSTFCHPVDDENICTLIDALGLMGTYWPVADRYRQLLIRVYNDYRNSEKIFAEFRRRVMPGTVKRMADMTKNAYDLNFALESLSMEDRNISKTSANGCHSRHDATSADAAPCGTRGTPIDGTQVNVPLFGQKIFCDLMNSAATGPQV